MTLIISLLALLATFYQLYLQRNHNEKSLKPLAQIVLGDQDEQIFVRIANNGVGPLIIDKITFIKEGHHHSNIEHCLTLLPKSYMHDVANADTLKKVVLPGSFQEVFKTRFDGHEGEAERENVKKQLSGITLKVDWRDIYDNKTTIERDFKWFIRHISHVN